MLDRYSEIIAHFIGQFDQDAEQSLFRLQYDSFRAHGKAEDEAANLRHVDVRVSSELALDDYAPDGARYVNPPPPPGPQADIGRLPWMPNDPNLLTASGVTIELHHSFGGTYVAMPSGPPTFDFAPPGSIVISALQVNAVQDNDVLLYRPLDLDPELAASRSETALDAGFRHLATVADALTPVKPMLSDDGSTATAKSITKLEKAFDAIDTDAMPAGADVTLVSAGAGTLPDTGILVDGDAADETPDTLETVLAERELVPDADDEAEDDDTGNAGETVTGETVSDVTDQDSLAEESAPQTITMGDNVLMNEAATSFSPVDAAVIAVSGVAKTFVAISQVNVLSDRDTIDIGAGAKHGKSDDAPGKSGPQGHNVVAVEHSHASWGAGSTEGDVTPTGFAVSSIDGDVILKSHVFQFNLICDNDIVTFETSWHEVEIGTGSNTSVDIMQILGFQTGFDMILVGGDMLSCVTIAQTNVLFDDDCVVGEVGTAGEVSTHDNLLWNEAKVGWSGIDSEAKMSDASASALDSLGDGKFDASSLTEEALLAGKEVPLLLTIGGNLVFEYHLEQFNLLTDADTLQLFLGAAAEKGLHPVDVSTGGNVLANLAHLSISGTDSAVMAGGGVYSDLVIYQAGMYDTDDGPLGPGSFGPALASEAVAFLADGMIDGPLGGPDTGGEIIIDGGGNSASLDALDSVLT